MGNGYIMPYGLDLRTNEQATINSVINNTIVALESSDAEGKAIGW